MKLSQINPPKVEHDEISGEPLLVLDDNFLSKATKGESLPPIQPKTPLDSDLKYESVIYSDTIPTDLKAYFFTGKSAPSLLTDYDAIGFDLDALVKYNTNEVISQLVRTYLDQLCQKKKYPSIVKEFDNNNLGVCLNNAVWDIENGTILKLTEGKFVSHALRGFTPLSKQEIQKLYGEVPIFSHLKWPETKHQLERPTGSHWTMSDVFDRSKVAVACHITHLLEKGKISGITQTQLAFDLNELDCASPSLKSQIQEDMPNYIQKQPDLKSIFATLRSNGKQVFLLSDSDPSYVDHAMEASIGPDWEKYIDLCVLQAKKPLFQKSESPFYKLDGSQIAFGEEYRTMQLVKNKKMTGGNMSALNRYFQDYLNKQNINVCYVGKNLINDVVATSKFNQHLRRNGSTAKWDTLAVIPELSKKQDFLHDQRFWGKDYFLEEEYSFNSWNKKGLPRNLFMAETETYARYAIPSVCSIRQLMQVRLKEFETEQMLMRHMGLQKAAPGEITLQVYDVSNGMAKSMSLPLLGEQIDGIWHTGIVVHGKEYYYGSGISYDLPAQTPFGQPVKNISLGKTKISQEEFMKKLKELRTEWSSEKYDLFHHNCNHFTNVVAKYLLGKGIPQDIVDLPKKVLSSPLGGMIKPMMENIQSTFKIKSTNVFDQEGNVMPFDKNPSANKFKEEKATYPQTMDSTANLLSSFASQLSNNSDGGSDGLDFLQKAAEMAQNISKTQKPNDLQRDSGSVAQNKSESEKQPQTKSKQEVKSEPKRNIVQISSIKQLEKVLEDNPAVIVYYWATWFKSCAKFKSVYQKACRDDQNKDIMFCAVHMDEQEKLMNEFQANSTPEIVAYVNGARKKSFAEPSEVQLSKLTYYLKAQLKPAVENITKLAELNTIIQTVPGVVLQFWAPWCGPTKEFKPIYDEIANKNKSEMITFVSINTDDAREISKKYKVDCLPQFIFFYQRNEYKREQITQQSQLETEVANLCKYTEQGYITPPQSSEQKYEFKSYMTEETAPPCNVIEIANKQHLLSVIKEHKAVVVKFWALWCAPCKQLKPHFEQKARENENKDLKFVSVNVDVAPDAAREFKVTTIPQTNFIVDGDVKCTLLGADYQKFDDELKKVDFMVWGKSLVDEFSDVKAAVQDHLKKEKKDVVEITSLKQLQDLFDSNLGVVADFWAPWCGPCLNFKPKFEDKSRSNVNKDVIFCSIDIDKNTDIADKYSVTNIPQFSFFVCGTESPNLPKIVGGDEERFNLMVDELDRTTKEMRQPKKGSKNFSAVSEKKKPQKEYQNNKVIEIDSLQSLQDLIKQKQGVIVDFWASWQDSCKAFRPVFNKMCEMNCNKKIFYATCQIDLLKECSVFYDVIGVPDFRFYLGGKQRNKLTGADIKEFEKYVQELNLATSTKAADHASLTFKVFSPELTQPTGFKKPGNIEKMKEVLLKYAQEENPGVRFLVDNFKKWIQEYDPKKVNKDILNELLELTSASNIKQKCAYFDLYRLLVLEENSARVVFGDHWQDLIDDMVIGHTQTLDLSVTNEKMSQIYAMTCLKFISNAFQTKWGTNLVYNLPQKCCSIVEFCILCLRSSNAKVIQYASALLINLLMGLNKKDNKDATQGQLCQALMSITQVLSATNLPPALGQGTEENILYALLVCECRILYQNPIMCQQIEMRYAKVFKERHELLAQKTPHQRIKDLIQDVISLIE